ncbi:winged helix DNA-binding domain-containing protein [Dyadobacter arcticus]|uniref:Winged helix DNA-binding domain-containing protein n=1 Tax=Dyadobacter arcticus TaxID=1078754 RepID=A0ABX0USE7_9BACT|nr:winged helix DNA-binding domain-containing protein [Dyadobacter arcticus]NIJ55901.1 hypothetical protein [Dyadobacter arcticus]
MTIRDILHLRLHNQLISNYPWKSPEEVVRWLGAMQAQDYPGAKWSIALRVPDLKDAYIDKALAARTIIRTWPMRGTLHFVAAEDARWMLKLLTPRIISGSAGRYRQLNLDDKVFNKSTELLLKAMEGGKQLMRSELFGLLEDNGIATADQRGMHIINTLAQNQILCHGIHNDKQPTYVLFDEWVTQSNEFETVDALGELALRYFLSHGPATIHDFVWWTGLRISDARSGLNMVSSQLEAGEVDGKTYWYAPGLPDMSNSNSVFLLPGFDEYMLGYTDRVLMLEKQHSAKIVPGNNGVFMPTIIVNGKVEGTWKRVLKKDSVSIEMLPFGKISQLKKKKIEQEAKKYGKYLDRKISSINWL